MYARIAGVVAIILAAAIAGYLLGTATAPRPIETAIKPLPKAASPASQSDGDGVSIRANPPLYFLFGNGAQADEAITTQELELAAAAGIQRFVITSDLPWDGTDEVTKRLLDGVARIAKVSPECDILIWLNLNPPESWLEQHPGERAVYSGEPQPFASPASPVWLEGVEAALRTFVEGMAESEYRRLISGGVLCALERGLWMHSGAYDRSPAATEGFRRWLRDRYQTDDALQAAWSSPLISLDTAIIPLSLGPTLASRMFVELPGGQSQVDYLTYTSETTAAAIVRLAAYTKTVAGEQAQVLVPYGFTYELTESAAGHFRLQTLLDSPVDGFVSPVSYVDRGLGGAGGFMGPVDSAVAHGKSWTILDDTRTGLEKDPATGAVTRMAGIRAEDIYNVQRRNFAAALTHELGLFWSDINGQGVLHDPEGWKTFGAMKDVYAGIQNNAPMPHPNSIRPRERTTLAVVVDEDSRFYQSNEVRLNEALVLGGRDAALRTGVITQFCLLSDVIASRVPPSEVYLFLNAFKLDESSRIILHEKLKSEAATAVWLYAPGYFDGATASVENISATTGMRVNALPPGATSGSASSYEGVLIGPGFEIGATAPWDPLFYVEDESADAIAVYKHSGRVSVAVKAGDMGWTSIYIAEPAINATLLREFLTLLERAPRVTSNAVEAKQGEFDTVHFGANTIAIHAHGSGERQIELTWPYDVTDLLRADTGWQQKHSFALPLKDGETRLFGVTPLGEEVAP